MSEHLKIDLELARELHPTQELQVLRAAFAQKPSPKLRAGLGSLLLQFDAFGDTIELLSGADQLNFREEMLLAQAYLSRETDVDSACALDAAGRALPLAETARARAAALALQAKAHNRLGEAETARAALVQALALDPLNKDACKRLAALDLAAGDPAAVLAMVDELASQGAAHARLFAARALAHAAAGDLKAARNAVGMADLHHARPLASPPGWDDIHAFNAALAEELLAHPGLRYERYGTASTLTWRIDAPATRRAPLVRLLLGQIAAAISSHVESLAAIDHPWVKSRPTSAALHCWCVITESDGFESWHVHQFGWLSGVYYVRIPDSIAHGEGDGGCIAFGLPEDLAGADAAAAYGQHLVRPQEGLMLAFPSHSYHRTFPHGLREKRICVAFDLRPN